ncbi:hypothetical protein [Photobacterium sp. Alg240-V54]|uniref:capsular polysaccharide export protein, LipB/KpsS family n=1 Tax=Photobacterium sp. Alg240-V54 TaxID=2305995 RepID=UPI0013D4A557|nr:hypothetical protein [Photobacterium sp. Alg240-V54]
MNDKKYNILTLDPMFSSLSNKICNLWGNKKYAIPSLCSFWIYLPNCEIYRVKRKNPPSKEMLDLVGKNKNLYTETIYRDLKRQLNEEEIIYFAQYAEFINQFIESKNINLIVMHNDTRWNHALVIELAKIKNIPVLVLELGLIRPNTTVVDLMGCNANSMTLKRVNWEIKDIYKPIKNNDVKYGHDTFLSRFYFIFFFLFVKMELSLFRRNERKYFYNQYSLSKYLTIIKNSLYKKRESIDLIKDENCKTVFLILQLENDSQLLVHGDRIRNQDLIDIFETKCEMYNRRLIIKMHPLEINKFNIKETTHIVDSCIKKISLISDYVFTVNSSASLLVLETPTPLYLLGNSVFANEGVAERVVLDDIDTLISNDDNYQYTSKRKEFLNYVKHNYLLHGAGFSYHNENIHQKLNQIMELV